MRFERAELSAVDGPIPTEVRLGKEANRAANSAEGALTLSELIWACTQFQLSEMLQLFDMDHQLLGDFRN